MIGIKYQRITLCQFDQLWELQKAYKAEIGEEAPGEKDKNELFSAIEKARIVFFGAFDGPALIGCCSVTVGFSTFDYALSGVFEDFYISQEYRHRGIARELVQYAQRESSVSSLTVGCADCDVEMYRSLGFCIHLGNLLAFGE